MFSKFSPTQMNQIHSKFKSISNQNNSENIQNSNPKAIFLLAQPASQPNPTVSPQLAHDPHIGPTQEVVAFGRPVGARALPFYCFPEPGAYSTENIITPATLPLTNGPCHRLPSHVKPLCAAADSAPPSHRIPPTPLRSRVHDSSIPEPLPCFSLPLFTPAIKDFKHRLPRMYRPSAINTGECHDPLPLAHPDSIKAPLHTT
jgi:hypothetical protein